MYPHHIKGQLASAEKATFPGIPTRLEHSLGQASPSAQQAFSSRQVREVKQLKYSSAMKTTAMASHADLESVDDVSHSSHSDHEGSIFTAGINSHGELTTNAKVKAAKKLKLYLSLLMVITALGFGAAVFLFSRKEERKDFEGQ